LQRRGETPEFWPPFSYSSIPFFLFNFSLYFLYANHLYFFGKEAARAEAGEAAMAEVRREERDETAFWVRNWSG